MNLRPEVQRFAELMELRLRANDHKPGWKQDILPALFRRLQQEAAELDGAIDFGTADEIAREAADVANFAMMIADVCGALEVIVTAPYTRPECPFNYCDSPETCEPTSQCRHRS